MIGNQNEEENEIGEETHGFPHKHTKSLGIIAKIWSEPKLAVAGLPS